jgi:hypothetical protein
MKPEFCRVCGAEKRKEQEEGVSKTCNDCKLIFVLGTRKKPESITTKENIEDTKKDLKTFKEKVNIGVVKVDEHLQPIFGWILDKKEYIPQYLKRIGLWLLTIVVFSFVIIISGELVKFAVYKKNSNRIPHLQSEIDSLASKRVLFAQISGNDSIMITNRVRETCGSYFDSVTAILGSQEFQKDNNGNYYMSSNIAIDTFRQAILYYDSAKNGITVKLFLDRKLSSFSETQKVKKLHYNTVDNWEVYIKKVLNSIDESFEKKNAGEVEVEIVEEVVTPEIINEQPIEPPKQEIKPQKEPKKTYEKLPEINNQPVVLPPKIHELPSKIEIIEVVFISKTSKPGDLIIGKLTYGGVEFDYRCSQCNIAEIIKNKYTKVRRLNKETPLEIELIH